MGRSRPTRPSSALDVSTVGTRLAATRVLAQALTDGAFVVGSVDHLPFGDRTALGAMSLDSLQYVTDKRATFSEVARVLLDRGRFAFTAFEVDPERVRDVPVLGVDPAAYAAVIAAEPELRPELGDKAMDALLLEMTLTLQLEPYPRRVFAVARSQ